MEQSKPQGEAKADSGAAKKPKKGKVQIDQELTLTKRIGRGRLGAVYAAAHEVLARRFAIRVFRAELTQNIDVIRRLRHTVRESSTICQSNVVGLTDFGQILDGRYYISMEFIRGIPLGKVLMRDGRFTLPRAVPLLIQLADALEAAHRIRVLHGCRQLVS